MQKQKNRFGSSNPDSSTPRGSNRLARDKKEPDYSKGFRALYGPTGSDVGSKVPAHMRDRETTPQGNKDHN